MDNHKRPERASVLDRVFDIGIILKGLDGVLELVGGLLLLLISPTTILAIVSSLTRPELIENPHDFIASHALAYVRTLSISTSLFIAAYLLLHGVVKVVLVLAVLKQKLWAYPWMIVFLLIFVGYQIYLLVLHASVSVILLTLFDIFIIWLTVLEYKKQTAKKNARLRSE